MAEPKKTDGWDNAQTVEAGFETTFTFENMGDVLVGTFEELTDIGLQNGDIATAAIFTKEDDSRVGVWVNHDLAGKLRKLKPGTLTRIEFVSERPIRKGLNPMKEFKVQTK